ncbi:MAG: (2,3-dihydroxybenzoyl)adenylate synthase [Candidatus Velthaea sp.]
MLAGCTPWPAALAAAYRDLGYWRGESLGAHLRRWAQTWPEREALLSDTTRLTYAQLDRAADARAAHLQALGLRDRDRLLVQLTNTPEFVILFFACMRTGVLPIMALPPHREAEITHFARHGNAIAYAIPAAGESFDYRALATAVRANVPSLQHILSADDPPGDPATLREVVADTSDVALFLLSGGTTGFSKLIPRTHDDYAYNFRESALVSGFDASTRYLAALPVAHNFPLASPGVLGVFESGGSVVLTNDPSPEGAFATIERERITHTAVVPTIALRWVDSPLAATADLSSLRVLQVGGARLAEEIARRVKPVLGATLQQVFGMAEGLLNFTRLDDDETAIVTTQGYPMCAADEVRFIDDDGNDVAPGEPGQLLTRGPYTLRGYFDVPEHNARAFTPDGFYCSGDIVRRTPSGHFIVEGRAKDLINRGGEKISAEDVENVLLAHPRVLEAAAVAMPDREFGERTCAYVILRDPAAPLTLADVRAHFATRGLAKFMTPERIEFVERFPLTNVGKVDKKALRADIAARLAERV